MAPADQLEGVRRHLTQPLPLDAHPGGHVLCIAGISRGSSANTLSPFRALWFQDENDTPETKIDFPYREPSDCIRSDLLAECVCI